MDKEQYPTCVAVVDVCVWRDNNGIEVLFGKRNKEGGRIRFPGGHLDPTDEGGQAGAERETKEETGVVAKDFRILDQIRVVERDAPNYAMFTTLYLAKHVSGEAVAGDDLDECLWINIDDLDKHSYADSHARLAQIAAKYLRWWRHCGVI